MHFAVIFKMFNKKEIFCWTFDVSCVIKYSVVVYTEGFNYGKVFKTGNESRKLPYC